MEVLGSFPAVLAMVLAILAMVLASITVLLSLLSFFQSTAGGIARAKARREAQATETELLKRQLELLQSSIEKAEMARIGDFEIGSLAARLDQLESDLKGFKRLLFDNPEATVTIPLIKKDIESLKEDNKRLREEIVRMSGFTKWFIGIMITMSIGLFGLAVSILLKG